MIYCCGGWSGGKLAYLLGTSVKFPYGDDTSYQWTQNKTRSGKLPKEINLGCRRKFISKGCLNYNSENSLDKLETFKRWDKFNIPHPRELGPEELLQGYDLPDKFLGRKNKASHGNGITLLHKDKWVEKLQDAKIPKTYLQNHDFFVEFLNIVSEHRIYVVCGEVLCEMNKKLSTKGFIHNKQFGAELYLGQINHPQKQEIVQNSIKAIHALELDFGAVDIAIDDKNNYYFLEANSDPQISETVGFLLADRFRRYFNMPRDDRYYIDNSGKVVMTKDLEKAIHFDSKFEYLEKEKVVSAVQKNKKYYSYAKI